jgi:hypothetical protein
MLLDASLIPIYGFSVVFLLLVGWLVYLHFKIRRLTAGKNGKSLEDSIVSMIEDIKKIHNFEKEAVSCLDDMEKRISRSVQAIETVRFNPFKGTGDGGNQSFSTAIISEKGDGVVFSSMYSRDRVSIFSKPLNKFESQFELTEEEKGVVEEAKRKIEI